MLITIKAYFAQNNKNKLHSLKKIPDINNINQTKTIAACPSFTI